MTTLDTTTTSPAADTPTTTPTGLPAAAGSMTSTTSAPAGVGLVAPVPGAGASKRVARLASEAVEAARVRALTMHPDVIALRVEKVRGQVDALLWAGIVLGLAFTAVNVQQFAAAGAAAWSLPWLVAWLLDPMVSLVLLAVLRAEQVTARYQVALPAWARRTKWLTFAATYVMNTWTSWGFDGGQISWSGVVLHSVPPLVVFATAETGPGLRDRLTEAVRRALVEHATNPTQNTAGDIAADPAVNSGAAAPPAHQPVHEPVHQPGHEPVPRPVHQPAAPAVGEPGTPVVRDAAPVVTGGRSPARRTARRRGRPTPRRLLADYLADARAALEAARARGEQIDPTPAWARRVTGCSAGTSVKVAAALRTPSPIPTTTVPSTVRTTEGEAA